MVTSIPKPKTHSVSFAPPNAPQAQATSAKPVQSCPTGTPDTPFRPGTSNKMTGFDNLSLAKTALKDEMAGAILPFPNKSTVNNLLKKAAKASDVDSFLHSSKHFSQVAGDWKDIRMAVDDEKKLYPKLLPIFEEILAFFHNTSNRSVFHLKQGKLVKMEDGDELKTAPDFLVAGAGPQFRRQDQAVAWRSCASFIDAKRYDKIPKSNSMNQAWEIQFCSYARQCFISHPTRIFVYGLCITERSFRLYRYDRCGALYSDWINYRCKGSSKLVQALALISSSNPADLGFDTTVRINESGKHVFSMKGDTTSFELTETSVRWHTWSLWGRATICWRVTDNTTGKKHLLKQQFINVSREPREGAILKELKDIVGVSKLLVAQEVGSKMSTLRGMKAGTFKPADFHDRVLYRLLLEEYGPTIDHVTDLVLLLKALRDAIQVHQDVWSKKKILHRDISTNNILYAIDPNAPSEGEKYGNLIDFELGVKIDRETTSHEVDFRTGTRAFQSVSVLNSSQKSAFKQLHDYLDDLESVFWVLVWILAGQLPPVNATPRINPDPPKLYTTFEADPGIAIQSKIGFLGMCKLNALAMWGGFDAQWGQETLDLVQKMGSFLYDHMSNKQTLSHQKTPVDQEKLSLEASDHYNALINMFDAAITKLEAIAALQPTTPATAMTSPPDLPPATVVVRSSSKRTIHAVASSRDSSAGGSNDDSEASDNDNDSEDDRPLKKSRSMPNTRARATKTKSRRTGDKSRTNNQKSGPSTRRAVQSAQPAPPLASNTDAGQPIVNRRSARIMKTQAAQAS
ncbi:hypothetical protein BJ165DRAFT_1531755 [Panaeolus papilionaceus]|nr:hypothetical protein BJ165DRAFT_1531755 [Panaeolus papilionaceus]